MPVLRPRPTLLFLALGLLLVASVLASLALGALPISPARIPGLMLGHSAATAGYERTVLLDIRLPRLLLALLIGAASGCAGAAMQGLLRNPLADPGLLGVSGGAALAAAAWLAFGAPFGAFQWLPAAFALPVVAAAGGLLATLVVLRIAQIDGQTQVGSMLLAGISINALAGAGLGLCLQLSSDSSLRDITGWLLGNLGRAGWPELAVAAPLLAGVILLLPRLAPVLDALLLGEAAARHLGIEVERRKRQILALVVVATATSVSLAGMIGFIGLVVPHAIRLLLGPSHRSLLPASALLGASLLALADLAARSAFAPLELSVGVLTALLGAPLFLWLLHAGRYRLGAL